MKLFGKKQYVGVRHLRAENTKPLKGALEKQLEVLRIPSEGGIRPVTGSVPSGNAEKDKVQVEN